MTTQGSTMAPTKKSDKAMSRPLPSSLAPGDADKSSVMTSNSAKVSSDKVEKSKVPFRYRWQKNGRFAYQDALIESENADNPGAKAKRGVNTKKSDANDDGGDESGDDNIVHHYTGGKTVLNDNSEGEESDVEFKQEDGSDDDYEGAIASKQLIGGASKKQQKQQYKMKNKTPNPNGRVVGRKLVMWHRPRMVEKLMLHLQYECHRAGIKLPWDDVVARLSTGSSGTSALQHINKMRDVLITEGHMVPPLLGKYSVPQDPTVRGYIRDMDAEKPTDTKVVRWGEKIEDRKTNLEVGGVIRGSGNYRRATTVFTYQRGLSKALEKTQKATGTPKKVKREASVSSRAASLDPAELDSDDEYDPSVTKPKGKYGLRKSAKPKSKYKVESSDDEADEDVHELVEEPVRRVVPVNTPQTKRLKGHDQGEGLITPPSTKLVTLHIRPHLLKQFAIKNKLLEAETGLDDEHSGDGMEDYYEDGSDCGTEDHNDSEAFGEYGAPARQYPQTPVHPLAHDIVRQLGYQGMDMHGTKTQCDQAIKNGLDPNVNGLKYKRVSASNSKGSVVAENRGSAVYKLAAPPVYPSNDGHNSVSSLARTSTGAFSGSPTRNNSTIGMNFGSFAEAMNGYGGQDNGSVEYGGAEQMVTDPFYSGHDHYTSGSDIFQIGSTSFNNSGLPAMSYNNNYDGQTSFEMGLDGSASFDTNNSYDALATTSSTFGFQVAADNTAIATLTDLDSQDDAVSLAHSTPPHYLQYTQEGDDNKENHGWYDY